MPEEKKPLFEELNLGDGLVCDPETGMCEIPGGGKPKPGVQPTAPATQTTKKGER